MMVKYRKILFLLLFTGLTLSANAKGSSVPVEDAFAEQKDKTVTLEIQINEDAKILLEKVVLTGSLEVYSILGVKITTINLKKCEDGTCSLTLAKGLYIFKAGKIAQKVIVR